MGYSQGYWPTPPPQPAPRPKRKIGGIVWFLAAMATVIAGVATYVLLQRLDDTVLAVLATVACAAGVALPALLTAMMVLLKRAENSGMREEPVSRAPIMSPPQFVVVPPMAWQQPQQQAMPPAMWDNQPIARQFTVVGDGGDGFD